MSRDPLLDIFNSVGGWQFFENLIDSFYNKIESNPVLRPMYPEKLELAKKKLMLFISQ
jgi:hemoglobin